MRFCASFILLLTIIFSCSKKHPPRINFGEVTVNGQKFVFDKLEAVFDTSTQGRTCEFRFDDRASNSYMAWETVTASKWIVGTYEYPGELFPGRSLAYMHLGTYVNGVPGSYEPKVNAVALVIDQAENGRMHGTLSGKMICRTCNPYGIEVPIKAEFEMPYSYR